MHLVNDDGNDKDDNDNDDIELNVAWRSFLLWLFVGTEGIILFDYSFITQIHPMEKKNNK